MAVITCCLICILNKTSITDATIFASMTPAIITSHRLIQQHLSASPFHKPADVVSYMGAMQAQDYLGSLWAIALRTKKSTEADIEKAIADKTIVRTWPMRGTLHFTSSENVRWMLEYLAPRPIARAATQHRKEGLTGNEFKKSRQVLEQELRDGHLLTRDEMYATLEKKKISCKGQRGMHIIVQLAQEGFICLATHKGKQHTFALLEEWIPKSNMVSKEEALYKLTLTYFTTRGPATLHDFIWWSGLSPQDARTAIQSTESKLKQLDINDINYWMKSTKPVNKTSTLFLPPFDEYLIAYKDRSATVDKAHAHHVRSSANGLLSPIIVHDGKIAGTWRREIGKDSVKISTQLFSTSKISKTALTKEAERYGKFLGLTLHVK